MKSFPRGAVWASLLLTLTLVSCESVDRQVAQMAPTTRPRPNANETFLARPSHPQERRLQNVRQLTFGGENAEAYLSSDDKKLVFQSKRPPYECDQIFTMNLDGSDVRLLSTGRGRTTCSYFMYPDDSTLLYSSTHQADDACPPEPDRSQGYVWPLYKSFDIYAVNADGTNLRALTRTPGYDAEATVHPDGGSIVFTSTRHGDLDIYSMKMDGSDVRRLTHTPGYDGGPFYSFDGSKIVYRASHPTGERLADYQRLLSLEMVRPSQMDIFVMDADGSNQKQLTDNGAANFCPFFHPDGKRILFSSNMGGNPREFDLHMVEIESGAIERITYSGDFDGFPMFTRDGKQLVFCSNRFNAERGETNIFIADWVE